MDIIGEVIVGCSELLYSLDKDCVSGVDARRSEAEYLLM